MSGDPHRDQPLLTAGAPLDVARAAVILVHGRGADAASILALAPELAHDDLAYLAPQAAANTWYPYPFLAPTERNEPSLGSAIARLSTLFEELRLAGFDSERVALVGFSQGACLAIEHTLRNPRRYGALIGFTGGFIGPPGDPRREPAGALAGTPVFLGSGDPDPHVPRQRFQETADLLATMGARVTARLYPGMPHTVNREEIDEARALLGDLG